MKTDISIILISMVNIGLQNVMIKKRLIYLLICLLIRSGSNLKFLSLAKKVKFLMIRDFSKPMTAAVLVTPSAPYGFHKQSTPLTYQTHIQPTLTKVGFFFPPSHPRKSSIKNVKKLKSVRREGVGAGARDRLPADTLPHSPTPRHRPRRCTAATSSHGGQQFADTFLLHKDVVHPMQSRYARTAMRRPTADARPDNTMQGNGQGRRVP